MRPQRLRARGVCWRDLQLAFLEHGRDLAQHARQSVPQAGELPEATFDGEGADESDKVAAICVLTQQHTDGPQLVGERTSNRDGARHMLNVFRVGSLGTDGWMEGCLPTDRIAATQILNE